MLMMDFNKSCKTSDPSQESAKVFGRLSIGDREERVAETLRTLEKGMKFVCVASMRSGGFGNVSTFKRPGSETLLAAKVVSANSASKVEMDIWSKLVHPLILQLEQTVYIPRIKTYTFITPLLETSLLYKLDQKDIYLNPYAIDSIKKWFLDILSALQYLHEHNLCHADLKTDNILISSKSEAVLCDFSFVNSTTKPVDRYGAPFPFFPPEACPSRGTSKPAVDGVYLDMWLVGMMALYAFSFPRLHWKLQFHSGRNWSTIIYPQINKEIYFLKKGLHRSLPYVQNDIDTVYNIKNFITMFLRLNPAARPSAQKAMEHKFLGVGQYYASEEIMWTNEINADEIAQAVDRYQERIRKSDVYLRRKSDPAATLPDGNEAYKFTEITGSCANEESLEIRTVHINATSISNDEVEYLQAQSSAPVVARLEGTNSYPKIISNLKCTRFELLDQNGQTFGISLLTDTSNVPFGSCPANVENQAHDEIENILTSFFVDANPVETQLGNQQPSEMLEPEKLQLAESGELANIQEVGVSKSQQQTDLTEPVKELQSQVRESLDEAEIDEESKDNSEHSDEQKVECMTPSSLSGEKAEEPRHKRMSKIRKCCCMCARWFKRIFCCKSKCCKK